MPYKLRLTKHYIEIENIKSCILSLQMPAALVPFPCYSFHLSQHFPALWKVAEATGYGLPQTIAHVVRPLHSAIVAFQVLKEAGWLTFIHWVQI